MFHFYCLDIYPVEIKDLSEEDEMFHSRSASSILNDVPLTNDDKQLIRTAFIKNLSEWKEKSLMNKTDFKCAWIYLFGYKPTKVKISKFIFSLICVYC